MIIGLTGRIAAGKGMLVEFLQKKGFFYSTFSNLVREEAAIRGLEITRNNLQDLGDELRRKGGAGIWAKKMISKFEPGKNYIADGIRNPAEVFELKKMRDFFLISIDAAQKIRFERMLTRGKSSDPKTWTEFLKIDERDFCDKNNLLGQQVGLCMELADFKIVNDGKLEDLNRKVNEIYQEINKKCYLE